MLERGRASVAEKGRGEGVRGCVWADNNSWCGVSLDVRGTYVPTMSEERR